MKRETFHPTWTPLPLLPLLLIPSHLPYLSFCVFPPISLTSVMETPEKDLRRSLMRACMELSVASNSSFSRRSFS